MYKKALLIFLVLILLIGCTQKEENLNGKEEASEDEPEVQETEEMKVTEPSITINSIDRLKEQVGGTLTENISLSEEIEQTYHIPSEKLNNQLKNIAEESNNAEEIYKEIVQLLGSPHYDETIKEAEDFEPIFINPYLPSTDQDDNDVWESERAIILLDINMDPLKKVTLLDIVNRFAEVIGQSKELALVLYGVSSSNGFENIYPMSTYDKETFENTLAQVETIESEDISLTKVFSNINEMRNTYRGTVTVYIFTDGGNIQNVDIANQLEELSTNQQDTMVNIIGIKLNPSDEKVLKNIDGNTQVNYFSVNNEEEIRTIIENDLIPLYSVDLGWVYQQSPGPWEVLDEYDRFDVELDQIRGIIKSEKERYDYALRKMRENGWIDREVANQVTDIILDDYRTKLELASDLRSEKLSEIDQRAE